MSFANRAKESLHWILNTIKHLNRGRYPNVSKKSEARKIVALSPGSDLPLPPRELIANRLVLEMGLLRRWTDPDQDSPIAAIYRIYEHICLDQYLQIRNEIEAFWYQSSWLVADIPDPKDPDPERYACLACIPALLCLAFNKRIDLGLPRDAPPIFSRDQLEEWRLQDRKLEEEPSWAEAVPRLETTLAIPHWDNKQRDFVSLDGFTSVKASPQFAKKNILIWQPHIHFA